MNKILKREDKISFPVRGFLKCFKVTRINCLCKLYLLRCNLSHCIQMPKGCYLLMHCQFPPKSCNNKELQDTLGGLEVKSVDKTWVSADPVPGTILINVGDLLENMSGTCLYRQTNGYHHS